MNTQVRLSTVDLPGLMSTFNRSSVGFDSLFDRLERTSNIGNQSYPPHDIIRLNDTEYVIRLAVAGFKPADVVITLNDRVLTVEGARTVEPEGEFLYRGISAKPFVKTFNLAEHVAVKSAEYDEGILVVKVALEVPEELMPRRIDIKTVSRG